MNRRGFIGWLAALPALPLLGKLKLGKGAADVKEIHGPNVTFGPGMFVPAYDISRQEWVDPFRTLTKKDFNDLAIAMDTHSEDFGDLTTHVFHK